MLTRRDFLRTSSLVSLTPFLPAILARTAQAAGAARDARSLVVIQLDGGNDGLNTVVPYADDAYARARVRLRLLEKDLHRLDDHLALHPGMRAAKELFDDARFTIVESVGYPNPDRSHFKSMRIWQTASLDEGQQSATGWLGRALDRGAATNPAAVAENSVYVGHGETPVSLWARKSAALSLASTEDLALALSHETRGTPTAAARAGSLQQFVEREVLTAYAAADEFTQRYRGGKTDSDSRYPATELSSQLKLISQLLQGDAEARVFYVSQTGYDTHAAQLNTHTTLLREFSSALKAFVDDLRAAKLDDRVVVLAFSEFGRRVAENDSQGTDHGAAGPVFLAGSPLRGGVIGAAPDLTDLDDGDLKMQVDFRQVYATLLDEWLGVPSREVLGAAYDPLPIFKA